jgi:V/A-type H+-transporting ATPase subunit I
LLVGLILLLLPTELFGSLYGSMIVFPSAVNTLAKVLTIVGLIGLVLFGAADTKNPLMRIGLGFYEVYNLTGWLSDILSYSRLLALGLATGVIAQVFNSMGSMVAEGVGGVFGVILFIVIFVIGHIFNLALNLLGAYVHTNRLQYVEFFGKFYEGGGVPFSPFKANTKYVDIKED